MKNSIALILASLLLASCGDHPFILNQSNYSYLSGSIANIQACNFLTQSELSEKYIRINGKSTEAVFSFNLSDSLEQLSTLNLNGRTYKFFRGSGHYETSNFTGQFCDTRVYGKMYFDNIAVDVDLSCRCVFY